MKDPSAEWQKAIHAKLVASSALATAMGGTVRAYDKVPEKPTHPYIRIGEDDVRDRSNSCSDGWDVTSTLHIFSDDPIRPRMVAKEISNLVALAIGNLSSPPTPTGFVVKELELVQARAFLDPDGVTGHGVLAISYLVRPVD